MSRAKLVAKIRLISRVRQATGNVRVADYVMHDAMERATQALVEHDDAEWHRGYEENHNRLRRSHPHLFNEEWDCPSCG